MLTAVVALGWLLARPHVAHGQDSPRTESALVWGIASFEVSASLSLGAMFTWDAEATKSSRYALYALPPLAVGLGMGLLGYRQEWDPAIPRAAHGALWGALDGFFVGALIDGAARDQRTGLAAGPWAYGLAGVGALAGGWLGAAAIEPGSPTQRWVSGPVVGGVAGLGVGGIPAILLALNGHDRAAGRVLGGCIVTGITAGMLVGLLTRPDENTPGLSVQSSTSFLLSLPPIRF